MNDSIIEICSYCGIKKNVFLVDKLVKLSDPCRGEYICAECEKSAQRSIDNFDKEINRVLGLSYYTDEEMEALRLDLEKLRIKRLNKDKSISNLSFFEWVGTDDYKEWVGDKPFTYSDNYREWCKEQYGSKQQLDCIKRR